MAHQHDTLLRQWHMLRLIPRYPRKIKAGDLLINLESEGFKVSKRTVERDLNELSSSFPLVLDDRNKPYGWSWQKESASFNLPGITSNEALTLVMVEQHLKNLLPNTTIDVLKPYFRTAHKFLDEAQSAQRVKSWLDKIRTVQPNQALLAPLIDENVQHQISDALLNEKQVEIQYKRRGDSDFSFYRIHPLALIQRGGVIYLYVKFFDYDDVKMMALHRIKTVKQLNIPVSIPDGFNIDSEISKGKLDFGCGTFITLKIKLTAEAGEHLFETPLAQDQNIDVMDDGSLIVTANVPDTPQLRWWLLALGDGIEVIEPPLIRGCIEKTLQSALLNYKS